MRKIFSSLLLLDLVLCLASVSAGRAADAAKDEDWKPLFNGTNFDGWYTWSNGKKNEDPNHLFQIHDGAVHMYKDAEDKSAQPAGYVATEKEYSHYRVRFQYKWGTKKFGNRVKTRRDAGMLYHAVGPDRVWQDSVECQVMENDTGDVFATRTQVTATVDPATTNITTEMVTNKTTGAVRTNVISNPVFKEADAGGVPYVTGVPTSVRRVVHSANCEVDGWNTVEVDVNGDSAVHIVNGKVNNRVTSMKHFVNGAWVPLTKGKIVFQQEWAEVMYRNIEIIDLDEPAQLP